MHFVGDQHDAVFIAQSAQPLHRLGLDGVETALALHRLKNNRRHTAGLDIALKQLLNRFLRFLQAGAVAGEGRVVNLGGKGAKTGLVGLHLAGQRHRKQAAPMEGAAKSDDAAALGVRTRNLDSVFYGFGASGEKRGFCRAIDRHDSVDAFGQRHIFRIGHDLVAGMGKTLQLGGNRGLYFGVDMAGIEHRDAAGKVDEAAALDVPKLGIFCVVDKKIAHHSHAARRGGQTAGMPVSIGAWRNCIGFGLEVGVHTGSFCGSSELAPLCLVRERPSTRTSKRSRSSI